MSIGMKGYGKRILHILFDSFNMMMNILNTYTPKIYEDIRKKTNKKSTVSDFVKRMKISNKTFLAGDSIIKPQGAKVVSNRC